MMNTKKIKSKLVTLTPTKLELPSLFKLIPLQVPDEYYRDGQIN